MLSLINLISIILLDKRCLEALDISIHHSMKGKTSNDIATVTFNKLISVFK